MDPPLWHRLSVPTFAVAYAHDGKACAHSTLADFFLDHDFGFPYDLGAPRPDIVMDIQRRITRGDVSEIRWPAPAPLTALYITRNRPSPSLDDLGHRVRLFLNSSTQQPLLASPGAIIAHIGDPGRAFAGLLYALDRQWVREVAVMPSGTRLYGPR